MKTDALRTPINAEVSFSLADEVIFTDTKAWQSKKVLFATGLLLAGEALRTNSDFELAGLDRKPLARLQGGVLSTHVVLTGAFNDFMPVYFANIARAESSSPK